MNTDLPGVLTQQLLHRICSEFAEMPGLQLTARQAQRLWGLDEDTCAQVLNALIEARFLRRTRNDQYARTTDGPAPAPRLRMAKVRLDPSPAADGWGKQSEPVGAGAHARRSGS